MPVGVPSPFSGAIGNSGFAPAQISAMLAGGGDGVRERLRAHDLLHRGRGGHRQAAEAVGLHDRRVAGVEVGIRRAEARGSRGPSTTLAGPVNHRSPSPATRMPNSTPLRAMVETTVEPSSPSMDRAAALARAHRPGEEELVVVARDEAHDRPRGARAVADRAHQRRGEPAGEEPRGGGVAHVHLVAHGEGLRHQARQVDRARRARAPPGTRGRPRRGSRPDPSGSPARGRRSGAGAPTGPSAMNDEAAVVPFTPILDDEHRHARRDDPRHRPHRAAGVAGAKAISPDPASASASSAASAPSPRTARPPSPRRAWARTCAPRRSAVPRAAAPSGEAERLPGRADRGPGRPRSAEAVQGFAIGGATLALMRGDLHGATAGGHSSGYAAREGEGFGLVVWDGSLSAAR